jgi:hypothetical protein
MFNITIDSKEYKFPERLTVLQWQRIMKLDIESPHMWPRVLATVFDIDHRDIMSASDKVLELGIGIVYSLLIKRTETTMKDLTQLTFGEWIDLDCWMVSDVRSNIEKMLDILGTTEFMDEALYKVDAYSKYRSYIYRQYAELFGLDYNEDDEIVTDEVKGQVESNSIIEGWFSIVISLASDNLLHIDAVTEQPLLKTFNFMAHQKQKQIAENFKKYKQQKEHELQRRR